MVLSSSMASSSSWAPVDMSSSVPTSNSATACWHPSSSSFQNSRSVALNWHSASWVVNDIRLSYDRLRLRTDDSSNTWNKLIGKISWSFFQFGTDFFYNLWLVNCSICIPEPFHAQVLKESTLLIKYQVLHFALDLSSHILDNIVMVRLLQWVLEKLLNSNIAGLQDACAPPRYKLKDD